MKIIQSGLIERKVKRLNDRQKAQLDDAIRNILRNPSSGEQKKGDLRMVSIIKFHIDNTFNLLAYTYTPELLMLIMFGPHENYYSELRRY